MTEFKVGDRVEVSNERKARSWDADVHKGEQGVVTKVAPLDCSVNLDSDPDGEWSPWFIPKNGLRIIKEEQYDTNN